MNYFVFVHDEIIFVEDDVNLIESNSRIYLRNEGQLIQGSGTTGNSGIGGCCRVQLSRGGGNVGRSGRYDYEPRQPGSAPPTGGDRGLEHSRASVA